MGEGSRISSPSCACWDSASPATVPSYSSSPSRYTVMSRPSARSWLSALPLLRSVAPKWSFTGSLYFTETVYAFSTLSPGSIPAMPMASCAPGRDTSASSRAAPLSSPFRALKSAVRDTVIESFSPLSMWLSGDTASGFACMNSTPARASKATTSRSSSAIFSFLCSAFPHGLISSPLPIVFPRFQREAEVFRHSRTLYSKFSTDWPVSQSSL